MKIVIQANPSRGKEIISLLESLGGSNPQFNGNGEVYTYYIDNNSIIRYDDAPKDYKVYTLEEFEKEFPFKIGDKVIDYEGDIAIITGFAHIEEKLGYSLQYENGRGTATPRMLKPYKEMKEERNITLTLNKAKEWYNKGGELKEIALQAFNEKELNPLPKSWEEYCMTYGCVCLSARYTNISTKYDSLIKLEQLRDCWRQGWIPDYTKTYKKYRIKKLGTEYIVDWSTGLSDFLVFQTEELAKEFLNCFKNLIEKVGDLI